MMENTWYRIDDGAPQGPVSVAVIRQKLLTRELDQGAQVARSEDGPWHPVSELHAVQDFSSEPDDARFIKEADSAQLAGPVRRWFARMFDTTFACVLVGLAAGLLSIWLPALETWLLEPDNPIILTVTILAAGLALDALIYRLFGNTLGKALLGLRVIRQDDHRLNGKQYLLRNLQVMIQGFGLGLPLVFLVTFILQWVRVGKGKPASYDATPGYRVEAEAVAVGWVAAFLALCTGVAFYVIY
jgi:uncharacterized RDD family membrane protein YckC